MTKKWYMSKTIWLNIVISLFATLAMMSDVVRPIAGEFADIIILAIAIVNGALRVVTTKGIQ